MNQEVDLPPIEILLRERPYSLSAERKDALLRAAMQVAYRHHFDHCAVYRKYCGRRGLDGTTVFANWEDFPYLPAEAFKDQAEQLCSVDAGSVQTRLNSSATSGVPSTILIDKVTAKRQVQALAAVVAETLGKTRRPFFVLDVDPQRDGSRVYGARQAATLGFLNLATEVRYMMRHSDGGQLALDQEAFEQPRAELNGAPVVVFGFTYIVYSHVVTPLLQESMKFRLPAGSKVVHIGGWKKLEGQRVSRAQFIREVAEAFGVAEADVIDFYGFTEQMGVTYPDTPEGDKCVPVFAEVVVRDAATLEPVPDGQEGLLQFITPLPHSYPGISVLTDDMGVITGRGEDATRWRGTHFRVLGRARRAEVRGCGDILGETAAGPALQSAEGLQGSEPGPVRVLFDSDGRHGPADVFAAVDPALLPVVDDLSALCDRLREARSRLDAYSVDELVALVAAASRQWCEPDFPLAALRDQGLLFLCEFCEASNLRKLADESLRGRRGYLDGFLPVDGLNRRMLKAVPRGLVVHWMSGNVPLLGMLVVVQAIVTRNSNLLKASSTFSSLLPALLEAFRDVEISLTSGKKLRGADLADTIAVIHFERDNRAAADSISQHADVRLAWGGREAIEAVLSLPRQYGSEDVLFGPKLSYMVIGREQLATERMVRKMARGAAVDASVFDQYACALPHTIFVESGGAAASPRDFAHALAEQMQKVSGRIPQGPIDAGTALNIQRARMRYELYGELWKSAELEWTILYDEDWEKGLAEPIYGRVVTVRAIDDILEASRFAHKGIQTIGLGLAGSRRLEFAERAASRGAERFPDIGRMTHFDSPWDGLFPIDRLVRWVSAGGPY